MSAHKLLLCVAAIGVSGSFASAEPATPIGSAVTIVNLVTAKLDKDEHKLTSGDDVHQQELIEADKDGRGELVLRDNTRLAVGPGSRLLLDRFVYNPDVSGGAIVLQLTRGAFRFITGVAAKPAYVIRTPTASITVRGTVFDVYVEEGGAAWLLLIDGAVEICTENGKCMVDDEIGKLVRIGPDKVDKPSKWGDLPERRDIKFESTFPFIVTPPEIDRTHHLTQDEVVLGTFPDRPPRHESGDDDGKKDDGKKGDESKNGDKSTKSKKDDDDDKPAKSSRTKRVREVEHRRKTRHASEDEGVKIPQSIGIGIGIGIGHHGGYGGGMGGNMGGGMGSKGR
jgi:hypothetical protein